MSKATTSLASLAVLWIAVVFTGCSGTDDSTPPGGSDQSQADDHAGHDHGDPAIREAMAQLSDEDRAAAEKQEVCPVSDGPLGSMGKPYKTTVTDSDGKEHVVFLCCEGCEDAIKKDPDKYLAKLDK